MVTELSSVESLIHERDHGKDLPNVVEAKASAVEANKPPPDESNPEGSWKFAGYSEPDHDEDDESIAESRKGSAFISV